MTQYRIWCLLVHLLRGRSAREESWHEEDPEGRGARGRVHGGQAAAVTSPEWPECPAGEPCISALEAFLLLAVGPHGESENPAAAVPFAPD